MINLFLDWLGDSSLVINDDIQYVFVCIASICVLQFMFDFFRFIMYYISERRK